MCLGTTIQSRGEGGCEWGDHTGFGLPFLAQQTVGTVGTSTTYLSLLTVALYTRVCSKDQENGICMVPDYAGGIVVEQTVCIASVHRGARMLRSSKSVSVKLKRSHGRRLFKMTLRFY